MVAALEAVVAGPPDPSANPHVLYGAAGTCAIASRVTAESPERDAESAARAGAFAAKAVGFLRRAIAADPADATVAKDDPDFEALR